MISETTGGAHALLTHSSKLSRVLLGSKGSVYSTARRSRRQACGVGSRARPSRKSSRRPASIGSPCQRVGAGDPLFVSCAFLAASYSNSLSLPSSFASPGIRPPHLVRSHRSLRSAWRKEDIAATAGAEGAAGAVGALRSRTEGVATAATRTLKGH